MKTLREAVSSFNSILRFIENNEPEENRIGAKYLYLNHPLYGMSVVLKANNIIHTGLVYIIFTSESVGKVTNSTAAYGSYSKLPCIYMYIIKDNIKKIPELFKENKITFIHEYVHFMNERDSKNEPSKENENPKYGKNPKYYFNSSQEFNAYYNEGLAKIHNITLMLAKAHKQGKWFSMYPDVSTFIHKVGNDSYFSHTFLVNLKKRKDKRARVRLARYYYYICEKWKKYKPELK